MLQNLQSQNLHHDEATVYFDETAVYFWWFGFQQLNGATRPSQSRPLLSEWGSRVVHLVATLSGRIASWTNQTTMLNRKVWHLWSGWYSVPGKYSSFSSGWEAGNGQTAIDVFLGVNRATYVNVSDWSYDVLCMWEWTSDTIWLLDILSNWSLKPKTSQGVTPTLSPKHLDTGRSTPMPVSPQLAVPRCSKRFLFCGPALVQSDGWITHGYPGTSTVCHGKLAMCRRFIPYLYHFKL